MVEAMGKDLNIQSCEVPSWTPPGTELTGPRRLLRWSLYTYWSSQTGEPLVTCFHFLKYNLTKNFGGHLLSDPWAQRNQWVGSSSAFESRNLRGWLGTTVHSLSVLVEFLCLDFRTKTILSCKLLVEKSFLIGVHSNIVFSDAQAPWKQSILFSWKVLWEYVG